MLIGSCQLLDATKDKLPAHLAEAVRWIPVFTTRCLPLTLPDSANLRTGSPERYWFASPVAIDSFLEAATSFQTGARRLRDLETRVGVVGARCATKLAQLGVPSANIVVAESLLGLCDQWRCPHPVQFFRARDAGQSYRTAIQKEATVVEIPAYETVSVASILVPDPVDQSDTLAFTSPRSVQLFDALHDARFRERPCRDARTWALGQRTCDALKDAGYHCINCVPYPNVRHFVLHLLLQTDILRHAPPTHIGRMEVPNSTTPAATQQEAHPCAPSYGSGSVQTAAAPCHERRSDS